MKGKGIMTTYWILGKGVSELTSPIPMPAGVPLAHTPSLKRQTSHHSSLAAVVFGMMQASKRTTLSSTRKSFFVHNLIHIMYLNPFSLIQ